MGVGLSGSGWRSATSGDHGGRVCINYLLYLNWVCFDEDHKVHTHARIVPNAVPRLCSFLFFFFFYFQVHCNRLGFHFSEPRTLKLFSDESINKISHAHFPAPSPGLHSPDPDLIFLVSVYLGLEGIGGMEAYGGGLFCSAMHIGAWVPQPQVIRHQIISSLEKRKKKILVCSSRDWFFFFSVFPQSFSGWRI